MIRTLAALALTAALSGCGLRVYQPDAFGKGKRLALVTLSAPSRVRLLTDSHSVSGAVGAVADGLSHDARPILTQTRAAIVKGLGSTGHYRLLPEKEVLGSSAYAAAQADPTRVLTAEWITPTGYRYSTTSRTRSCSRGSSASTARSSSARTTAGCSTA